MNTLTKNFLLWACALSASAGLWAQSGTANMAYVYPAGGQAGTTFKVWVGGSNLQLVKSAVISGGGAEVKFIETDIPDKQNVINRLRKEVEKLVLEEHPTSDVEELSRRVNQYFKDHPQYGQRRVQTVASIHTREISTDALADIACFEVTLKPDAKPGMRAFCVRSRDGASNVLPFYINTLPELVTPLFRDIVKEDARQRATTRTMVLGTTADQPRPYFPEEGEKFDVTLPVIVNGQVTFAKPDNFFFEAKKGQQIVIAVWARALIPFISDAVPGWFQSTVTVLDSQGRMVAQCDDYYHDPDPMLCFNVPEDGKYCVQIADAVSRGREDFTYRMLIGEVPFATHVYPPLVRKGQTAILSLRGWNLPVPTVSFTQQSEPQTQHGQRDLPDLHAQGIFQKELPLHISTVAATQTQTLQNGTVKIESLPAELAGIIDTPGRINRYQFDAKAGQTLLIETRARRLNLPTDTFLILKDEDGKPLAHADDFYDDDEALITHHADARLTHTFEKDTTCTLEVSETQGRGGEDFSYVLSIGEPVPDFSLSTVPVTINAVAGKTTDFAVYAVRKNGFDGPIRLRGKRLPEGAKLSGAKIPAGASSISLTLTLPKETAEMNRAIVIEGVADFGEEPNPRLPRAAAPSELMMQAFYIWHRVPYDTHRLLVRTPKSAAIPEWIANLVCKPVKSPLPLKLPRAGGKVTLEIGKTAPLKAPTTFDYSIKVGPDGLSIEAVRIENGVTYLDLAIDPSKTAKAPDGNLVITVRTKHLSPKKEAGKPPRVSYNYIDTIPAIPYVFDTPPPREK